MSYTTLSIDADGIALLDLHLERLAGDSGRARDLEKQLAALTDNARPAVYSARVIDTHLSLSSPRQSQLAETVSCRMAVSPFQQHGQPFAKPAPPSPYDSVRSSHALTLLTDPAQSEFYEACIAGLLAFSEGELIAVPLDRPRVDSLTEKHLEAHFHLVRRAILTDSEWPLAAFNAAVGVMPLQIEGRKLFPEDAIEAMQESFRRSRRHPRR